jgi:hypothetical protein
MTGTPSLDEKPDPLLEMGTTPFDWGLLLPALVIGVAFIGIFGPTFLVASIWSMAGIFLVSAMVLAVASTAAVPVVFVRARELKRLGIGPGGLTLVQRAFVLKVPWESLEGIFRDPVLGSIRLWYWDHRMLVRSPIPPTAVDAVQRSRFTPLRVSIGETASIADYLGFINRKHGSAQRPAGSTDYRTIQISVNQGGVDEVIAQARLAFLGPIGVVAISVAYILQSWWAAPALTVAAAFGLWGGAWISSAVNTPGQVFLGIIGLSGAFYVPIIVLLFITGFRVFSPPGAYAVIPYVGLLMGLVLGFIFQIGFRRPTLLRPDSGGLKTTA